ncbi:hypothetical protein GCM10027040_25870 [Halomonas shantousis]
MTVRVSWILVLAAFTGLILAVSALGGYAVQYGQGALDAFNKVDITQKSTLNRANSELMNLRLEMQEYFYHLQSSTSQDIDASAFDGRFAEVNGLFASFFDMDIPPRHQALVDRIKADYQPLITAMQQQMAALEAGDLDAYTSQVERVGQLNDTLYASANDYFVTVEKQGTDLYQAFKAKSVALEVAIGIAVALALVVVAIVLWGVTVNVINPLKRIVGHFERLSHGDLSAEVESRGDNEIGKLFSALSRMQENLSRTVGTVREGSDNIYAGSRNIAQGNIDLSSRTEQQAASLEETASSMEQLTSTVQQNADNARQASQLASNASQTAQRGGEVVGEVVATMRGITQGAHQMAEIVEAIDSIAFQTNILALNASVEAARAGEQGRGFAVVAGEVRSLASRSAASAKEIRDLIGTSVERVESGSVLVDQAGRTMGDIVAAVQRVTDIMDEIAAASQEQSNGIGQVNQAIAQMDQVTQQNASLVQDAASSAADLERQAAALREAVAVFRLSGSAGSDQWTAAEVSHGAEPKPEGRGDNGSRTAQRLAHDTPKNRATDQTKGQAGSELEWDSF